MKLVTFYPSLYDNTGEIITLTQALSRIKNGNSNIFSKIRAGNYELKRNLPVVQFTGEFTDKKTIKYASGLAILDFDKAAAPERIKKELMHSVYMVAVWLSPSGNGVKALVRIPYTVDKKIYKQRYAAILRHYKELNPDQITNNIDRLCFESYDPNILINDYHEIFTGRIEAPKVKKQNFVVSHNNLTDGFSKVVEFWESKYSMNPGERNHNIYVLSCLLSEHGQSITDTQNYCAQFQRSDFTTNEINKTITSAYNKTNFNSKS